MQRHIKKTSVLTIPRTHTHAHKFHPHTHTCTKIPSTHSHKHTKSHPHTLTNTQNPIYHTHTNAQPFKRHTHTHTHPTKTHANTRPKLSTVFESALWKSQVQECGSPLLVQTLTFSVLHPWFRGLERIQYLADRKQCTVLTLIFQNRKWAIFWDLLMKVKDIYIPISLLFTLITYESEGYLHPYKSFIYYNYLWSEGYLLYY